MKRVKKDGRRVAELRRVIGKSQSQFATMIGVSVHTIISVENGRNSLSPNLAKKIQVATGANIQNKHLCFEPISSLPQTELGNAMTPKAREYLKRTYANPSKNDALYTREDFEQWRTNFSPSNDKVARRQFDQLKMWIELLFRAAAKPGVAGNCDRLPAVRQSLVDWLNETVKQFKLGYEVDKLLEKDIYDARETTYFIDTLINPTDSNDLERSKQEIEQLGYDFNELEKHFKKAKPNDVIVLEIESRRVWDPFNNSTSITCARSMPSSKSGFRIMDRWDSIAQSTGMRREDVMKQIAPHLPKPRKSRKVRAAKP